MKVKHMQRNLKRNKIETWSLWVVRDNARHVFQSVGNARDLFGEKKAVRPGADSICAQESSQGSSPTPP